MVFERIAENEETSGSVVSRQQQLAERARETCTRGGAARAADVPQRPRAAVLLMHAMPPLHSAFGHGLYIETCGSSAHTHTHTRSVALLHTAPRGGCCCVEPVVAAL